VVLDSESTMDVYCYGAVTDAVETEIQYYDTEQLLPMKDYDMITGLISHDVSNRMLKDSRVGLTDEDRAFIQSKVRQMVDASLKPKKSRFEKFDRVVCMLGGEYGWGAGTIQALDEDDPEDATGQTKLPYVVKLDPPIGRLISVPQDDNDICRAEVCFGQRGKGDLWFTLRCKPTRCTKIRRFGVGDRVACAVEDTTGNYTVWAAGTVVDVNYNVEQDAKELSLDWDWAREAGIVPYRVLLDTGINVFVHRDMHWLVRDLVLQPVGPRQSADGTRNLKRLVKRRHGDTDWELVDHATRKVRIQAGDADDEDSDED